MQSLYRVLYCSRTHMPEHSDEADREIHEILAASRRNNARAGITGGLLFSAGCFAQVLEGPVEAVMETFERIQCDQRHRTVTVLHTDRLAARDFPSWSMAYAGAESARDPLARRELVAAASGVDGDGQTILDMLKAVIVREDDRLRLA